MSKATLKKIKLDYTKADEDAMPHTEIKAKAPSSQSKRWFDMNAIEQRANKQGEIAKILEDNPHDRLKQKIDDLESKTK